MVVSELAFYQLNSLVTEMQTVLVVNALQLNLKRRFACLAWRNTKREVRSRDPQVAKFQEAFRRATPCLKVQDTITTSESGVQTAYLGCS